MIATLLLGAGASVSAQQDKSADKEKQGKEKVKTTEPVKERKLHISDYLSVGGFINTQY